MPCADIDRGFDHPVAIAGDEFEGGGNLDSAENDGSRAATGSSRRWAIRPIAGSTQSFCRRTAWKRNSKRRMRCGSKATASTGGMPTSIKAPPGRSSDWPCSTQAGSPEHSNTRSSPCGSAWTDRRDNVALPGVAYRVGPAPPGDRKTIIQEIGHHRGARSSRFRTEQHRQADRTGAEDGDLHAARRVARAARRAGRSRAARPAWPRPTTWRPESPHSKRPERRNARPGRRGPGRESP